MVLLFALSPLDDYDQAKHPFVSYQMLEQLRWLFQTVPTEGLPAAGTRHSRFHINSKPPAVGWAWATFVRTDMQLALICFAIGELMFR